MFKKTCIIQTQELIYTQPKDKAKRCMYYIEFKKTNFWYEN